MKIRVITWLVLIALFMQTSCATILAGGKNATRVQQGNVLARVYYNNNYVGEAPTRIKIPKSSAANGEIRIAADGYKEQKIPVTRKVSAGWLIVDIIFGIVPLAVDFATGAIYKPRPNTVNYYLEKADQ